MLPRRQGLERECGFQYCEGPNQHLLQHGREESCLWTCGSPATIKMMPPVIAIRAFFTLSSPPQRVHFMPIVATNIARKPSTREITIRARVACMAAVEQKGRRHCWKWWQPSDGHSLGRAGRTHNPLDPHLMGATKFCPGPCSPRMSKALPRGGWFLHPPKSAAFLLAPRPLC